jgi:hypothetical protein
MLGAAVAERLDAVCNAAPRQQSQALESDRWPSAVAHQTLSPDVIVGSDGDAGVQIEPVELDSVGSARWPA